MPQEHKRSKTTFRPDSVRPNHQHSRGGKNKTSSFRLDDSSSELDEQSSPDDTDIENSSRHDCTDRLEFSSMQPRARSSSGGGIPRREFSDVKKRRRSKGEWRQARSSNSTVEDHTSASCGNDTGGESDEGGCSERPRYGRSAISQGRKKSLVSATSAPSVHGAP